MSTAETLEIAETDHIVEITLARPALLNRIDDQSRAELISALEELGDSTTARAIVLGAQGKAFSAGGDFAMMKRRHGDRPATERGGRASRRLLEAFLDLPMPVIAAVQGDAVGLGSTIVLSCDAVVAARGVRIMDSHVRVGLVAGDGGAVLWPLAMGIIRAKRHLLTGDPVFAEEAYEMGMVSDLVEDPADVLPAARALAARIAALPPLGVRGTKRALNHVLRQRFDEVIDLSLAYEGESMHSDDLLEAIAAFEEKRPGTYTGG
ncbi:enoyl-CoA hydratase/isomerase family protein [Mycolicibacterium sp. P9-22]|uniref:enoyl-CoA hydratase/isomerase family protein n=1 Tax=Mycolicibacterium sp. P9-22 TaxID=2024613 RepID=UPI0011EBD8EF|nr:enoyl-CoA hydratase/isomerase family protein [Mycolicibacterium sp. P9-22]KAA0120612.1 enoyl-CoA hydratase/isomerase family protein [Mycolicibacterium sp. P9-22]